MLFGGLRLQLLVLLAQFARLTLLLVILHLQVVLAQPQRHYLLLELRQDGRVVLVALGGCLLFGEVIVILLLLLLLLLLAELCGFAQLGDFLLEREQLLHELAARFDGLRLFLRGWIVFPPSLQRSHLSLRFRLEIIQISRA